MAPMSSPGSTTEHDEDALKELIAGELGAVRDRSLGLTTDVLADADLIAQVSPLMSPLVWDLAHIGNYVELWLLRAAAGIEPMRPEIDSLYDAFEHPRAERPALPLLPPGEARSYIQTVRAKVLDSLPSVRFDPGNPLTRSEEHTSELQSRFDLVCRLLLEKKKYMIKCYMT